MTVNQTLLWIMTVVNTHHKWARGADNLTCCPGYASMLVKDMTKHGKEQEQLQWEKETSSQSKQRRQRTYSNTGALSGKQTSGFTNIQYYRLPSSSSYKCHMLSTNPTRFIIKGVINPTGGTVEAEWMIIAPSHRRWTTLKFAQGENRLRYHSIYPLAILNS